MTNCKIINTSGNAVVVSYWDDEAGMMVASIISVNDLPVAGEKGQEVQISKDVLDSGTEYGIDWRLLLDPDKVLVKLMQALRNRGIWTEKDIRTNSSKVIEAIINMGGSLYAEMLTELDNL